MGRTASAVQRGRWRANIRWRWPSCPRICRARARAALPPSPIELTLGSSKGNSPLLENARQGAAGVTDITAALGAAAANHAANAVAATADAAAAPADAIGGSDTDGAESDEERYRHEVEQMQHGDDAVAESQLGDGFLYDNDESQPMGAADDSSQPVDAVDAADGGGGGARTGRWKPDTKRIA